MDSLVRCKFSYDFEDLRQYLSGVVDQIQAQHEQISQQSYLIDEIHLSLSRVKGVATDAALATQQAVADLTAEDKQKSTQIEVLANQFRNARGQIANLEKFKTYALVQLQKQQKKCRKQQVLLKEQATKQALLSKQQRKFNQYFFNQLRVLKTEQKRERRSWAQQERHTHSVETSLSSLASSSVMKDGDDRKTVRNEKPLKEGDKNHRSVVDKDNGDDEGEDKHEDDSGYMDELGDLILFDEDVDEDEGGEDDKNDEEEEEDVEFEDDHAYNDKEINNEGKGHESSGGDSDASDGANCMDAQTALSRLDRMEYVFNALTPSPQASAPLPLLSIEGRSTNKQNGDSSGNPTQRSASINDDSTVLDSSKQQQQLQHHNEIGDTNNTGTSNNQNTSQIDKDISRSSNDDDHSEKSSSPIHSQTNSHNAMSTGLNHHLRPLISSQTDEIRALITETRKLSRRVHACETNIKIIDSGQGGGKSSSSSNNSIKNKAHHHNDEDKDINQTSPQSGDTACAHTAHSHAQIEKLSTSVLQKVSADLGELVAAKVQDEIQVQESLIEKVQGRVDEAHSKAMLVAAKHDLLHGELKKKLTIHDKHKLEARCREVELKLVGIHQNMMGKDALAIQLAKNKEIETKIQRINKSVEHCHTRMLLVKKGRERLMKMSAACQEIIQRHDRDLETAQGTLETYGELLVEMKGLKEKANKIDLHKKVDKASFESLSKQHLDLTNKVIWLGRRPIIRPENFVSLQYFDAHNKKVQDRISTFTSTVHRKLKTFGRNVNDLMRQLHLSQRASERMERVGRGLESSTVMAGGVVHTSPVFTFTPHMHAQSQIIQPAQSAQSAQSSGERWRRKAPLTTHHAARSKNKDSSTAHTSTRPSEHSFTRAELNGYLQHKMVVVGRGKEKEEKEGVRTLRMMLEQEPEAQAREEDVYRLEYGARAHIDIHERSRDGMDRGGGERGGVGNERGAMRIQGDRDNGVEDDMERRRVYKQAFSALEMIQPTHNSQKTQTLVHTNPHPANHEKALFVPHPPRHAPPPQIE